MINMSLTSLEECLESDNPFCQLPPKTFVEKPPPVYQNPQVSAENNTPWIHPTSQLQRPSIMPHDDRNDVYQNFISYFGDLLFTKDKTTKQFSIYMAHLKTGLGFGSRVLVAVVPEDGLLMGTIRPLNSLKWVNFQTRQLNKEVRHQPQVYGQRRNDLMTSEIIRTDRSDDLSTYEVIGTPLTVQLRRKKGSIQEWSDRNKLYVALETFQASVSFKN